MSRKVVGVGGEFGTAAKRAQGEKSPARRIIAIPLFHLAPSMCPRTMAHFSVKRALGRGIRCKNGSRKIRFIILAFGWVTVNPLTMRCSA